MIKISMSKLKAEHTQTISSGFLWVLGLGLDLDPNPNPKTQKKTKYLTKTQKPKKKQIPNPKTQKFLGFENNLFTFFM